MWKLPEPARAASPARDAFTFSLGGIRTIASFTPPHAIAADQIDRARGDRGRDAPAPRRWFPRRRRVLASACP